MALTRTQIINLINDYIYPNGNQRITGGQLNEILLAIANSFAMEGGSASGLDAVLAKGSNVSNGRNITNNNGGKIELAGEYLSEKEELFKFIGFHSLLGIYDSIIYNNPAITAIGNARNVNMFGEKMVKDGFRAMTQYDVRAVNLDKAKESLRGILSTVESESGKTLLYQTPDSVNTAIFGADGNIEPFSYLTVAKDSIEAKSRSGKGDSSFYSRLNLNSDQVSIQIAGGPQSSSHMAVQSSVISNTIYGTSGYFKSNLYGGSTAWESESGKIAEINPNGLLICQEKSISLQATGVNPTAGIATLVAGTVVVTTNAVRVGSVISLTVQESGENTGNVRVSSKTAGASFTISSSVNTDNCSVFWQIIDLI